MIFICDSDFYPINRMNPTHITHNILLSGILVC